MSKRQMTRKRYDTALVEQQPLDIASLIIEDGDENEEQSTQADVLPYSGRDQNTTVLACGTTFIGDVKTDGHLEIAGTLFGDAEAKGNIIVSGKIEGNVSGDCILLNGCAVKGDVKANGELTLGEDSVVIGHVEGENAAIGGKVRGNVKSRGALVLREGSLIVGDVEGRIMTMQEGCALFGEVRVLSKENEKLTDEDFGRLFDSKT